VAAADFPIPAVDLETWRTRGYECRQCTTPPVIDGLLDDAAWQQADWTEDFVDIEGNIKPVPRFRTRAKMSWDEDYFYVAAEMEEPHLWAELTEHDAVIYHENDFELFLDPDGDTHNYYELEINAINTVWDLLLTRPYRDGGHAVDSWEIPGLKTAVHLDGTLNDPRDVDRGWNVEMALPWSVLEECARHSGPPSSGESWRVNFSRVQWRLRIENGAYVKEVDPKTGKSLPENNWVWSPQGLVAMHYPEMWGCVRFTDMDNTTTMQQHPPRRRLSPLLPLYYAQKLFFSQHSRFAGDASELDLLSARIPRLEDALSGSRVEYSTEGFLATFHTQHGYWIIDHYGRSRYHRIGN